LRFLTLHCCIYACVSTRSKSCFDTSRETAHQPNADILYLHLTEHKSPAHQVLQQLPQQLPFDQTQQKLQRQLTGLRLLLQLLADQKLTHLAMVLMWLDCLLGWLRNQLVLAMMTQQQRL